MRIVTNICRRTQAVSKRLAEAYKIPVITSYVNHRLIMRLQPMSSDKSWRSIKAQWKKDAESVGEDFSTFSNGSYAAFDALTKDGDNPTLYCLSDGEKIHAACQVSRLMMSKFPTPILRARFVVVSPLYELGVATSGQYAQTMVALFSGIVWLSRDTLSAGHVRFFLKSPGDAQFFAALQVVTELSPFSAFAIDGALIECSLKELEVPEMA